MTRGAAIRGAAIRGAAAPGPVHRRVTLVALSVAWAVSACHTVAPKERAGTRAVSVSPPVEMPSPAATDNEIPAPNPEAPKPESGKSESGDVPACACADNTVKPAPKRKPKPAAQTPPPTPSAVAPAAAGPGEASVKVMDSPSASILGKKVRAQDAEDLGRVVDILADGQGRVRIAVIEFGGFLGVGNRRIAVDWSLLKFQPGDEDAPVTVEASKAQLQATPEFKGNERPPLLMAPAMPASPPAAPQ